MMQKFRLFRRGKTFWCEDTESGHQQSLGTKKKADATHLLHGRNETHAVPFANLQMARAYMMAAAPKASDSRCFAPSMPWRRSTN